MSNFLRRKLGLIVALLGMGLLLGVGVLLVVTPPKDIFSSYGFLVVPLVGSLALVMAIGRMNLFIQSKVNKDESLVPR